MASDYLIVNKKILPEYLERVIHARELITGHEVSTVTEAVRQAGISRNTYYKYKDVVFRPEDAGNQRKAVISLVLRHEAGSLSLVLSALSAVNASVITISQSIPVAGKASVIIAMDISEVRSTSDDLIRQLKKIRPVISVHLDAME